MKRYVSGLNRANASATEGLPNGLFLVRVERVRDFGYDTELLGRDEIDDKNIVGLSGVVKITHSVVNGTSLLNLDGFAPRSQWEELSVGIEDQSLRTKAAS